MIGFNRHDSSIGSDFDGIYDQSSPTNRRRLLTGVRVVGSIILLLLLLGGLTFGLLRILGPEERFSAFDLPYVEDFAAVDVERWFVESGVWSIRNDALAQITNLDESSNIFVPKRVRVDQPYHLSTYVTLSPKTDRAGINFNAQYPGLTGQMHQVYLTREDTDEDLDGGAGEQLALVAGYTADDGSFIPQVTLPLTSVASDFRLDLYVYDNTYRVQLNGQDVIEKRPLFYPNGLVGYHSKGPVTFDALKISAAEGERSGELVYTSDFELETGGAGWVPFSGDWQIEEGALVQSAANDPEAGIGYEGSSFENFLLRVSLRHLAGSGGGILFNMPSPYQVNGSQMIRFSDQTDSLFWGYYDNAGSFVRQGFTDIDAVATQEQLLRIYSDESLGSYDIYLGESLIARGVPQQRSNGHIGLLTAASRVAFPKVEVFPIVAGRGEPLAPVAQPTTPPASKSPANESGGEPVVAPAPQDRTNRVAVTTMQQRDVPDRLAVPVIGGKRAAIATPFDDDLLGAGWRPIAGEWIVNDGRLLQQDTANANQAIVYTPAAFRDFSFGSVLTHVGTANGAGLLFNMPYSDQLNGAHMVRYSDRTPGGMFWGYFDEDGTFVGQGHTNVYLPFNQPHKLRIVSGESTYNIYLDNVLLVSDVPLRQNSGYVGLLTFKSAAYFDSPWVGDPDATDAVRNELAPDSDESTSISGEWQVEDGVFRQLAPEASDHLYNTGIFASNYVAEAAITLPDRPDAGGGFVVHLADRRDRAGAFMVRLIRGGQGIFWGTYDETGRFQGRGSTELNKNPAGIYRVQVTVAQNRLDISVNDQTVATQIIMPRSEGWIGLAAHSGPVAFRDVSIDVALAAEPSQP